jgi:hypothetical protein
MTTTRKPKSYLQVALNERGWSRSEFTAGVNQILIGMGLSTCPENTVVRYCEGRMRPTLERRMAMERLIRDSPVAGGLDPAHLWMDFSS